MFKITQDPTYTWPVSVEFPADGGKVEKATFDAEFKRLTQSRVDEIRLAVERNDMRDIDLAREALVGWSGIVDANGAVPFSESARDQLLEIPMLATSIVVALLNSLAGARRKN